MGEERKTLKSSLLPLRAPLGSGSASPVLQAVELYVSTACCCAEASWDNFPQLCQSWLFPHGWGSGAAARLGFEKPEPTSSFFKSLSSFVALLSPSLDFLPLFTLPGEVTLPRKLIYAVETLRCSTVRTPVRHYWGNKGRGDRWSYVIHLSLGFPCPLGWYALRFHCFSVKCTSCWSLWVL